MINWIFNDVHIKTWLWDWVSVGLSVGYHHPEFVMGHSSEPLLFCGMVNGLKGFRLFVNGMYRSNVQTFIPKFRPCILERIARRWAHLDLRPRKNGLVS